jgi:hypothetical protein
LFSDNEGGLRSTFCAISFLNYCTNTWGDRNTAVSSDTVNVARHGQKMGCRARQRGSDALTHEHIGRRGDEYSPTPFLRYPIPNLNTWGKWKCSDASAVTCTVLKLIQQMVLAHLSNLFFGSIGGFTTSLGGMSLGSYCTNTCKIRKTPITFFQTT